MPALKLAQAGKATIIPKLSGWEDFSGFPKGAPGFFFFFLGAPSSHSPLFYIDEDQQHGGQLGQRSENGDFKLCIRGLRFSEDEVNRGTG